MRGNCGEDRRIGATGVDEKLALAFFLELNGRFIIGG